MEDREVKTSRIASIAGATAGLAVAATATAGIAWDPDLDIVIDLGNVNIPFLGTVEFNNIATTGEVVGWSFSGNFSSGGAYTDETQLQIINNGNVVQTVFYDDWDFFDEWQAGFYAHGVGGEQWGGDGNPDTSINGLSGTWSLSFSDPTGWGPIVWGDAQIVFHRAVPGPGALALLALAGMIGNGRRRR
jgi:hypothetical protein